MAIERKKPSVGDTVCLVYVGSNRDNIFTSAKVTRVGRKYFDVESEEGITLTYDIQTSYGKNWVDQRYSVYESEQAYKDSLLIGKYLYEFYRYFNSYFPSNNDTISLEDVRSIAKILNIEIDEKI